MFVGGILLVSGVVVGVMSLCGFIIGAQVWWTVAGTLFGFDPVVKVLRAQARPDR